MSGISSVANGKNWRNLGFHPLMTERWVTYLPVLMACLTLTKLKPQTKQSHPRH